MAKDKFKAKKKPEPLAESEEESSNWPELPTLQDVIDAWKEREKKEEE